MGARRPPRHAVPHFRRGLPREEARRALHFPRCPQGRWRCGELCRRAYRITQPRSVRIDSQGCVPPKIRRQPRNRRPPREWRVRTQPHGHRPHPRPRRCPGFGEISRLARRGAIHGPSIFLLGRCGASGTHLSSDTYRYTEQWRQREYKLDH